MAQEIQFVGFGGQGIVLSGYLLGKALSIYDKKNASMTQSYGPEARGGACSSGVVLSDSPDEIVDYPKVRKPDILICMSQEAYLKYIGELKFRGTLIYDSDLVETNEFPSNITIYPIPATKKAEELGKKIVANVVMLGSLQEATQIVSLNALIETVKTSVKKDFVELNIKALEKGVELAKKIKTRG